MRTVNIGLYYHHTCRCKEPVGVLYTCKVLVWEVIIPCPSLIKGVSLRSRLLYWWIWTPLEDTLASLCNLHHCPWTGGCKITRHAIIRCTGHGSSPFTRLRGEGVHLDMCARSVFLWIQLWCWGFQRAMFYYHGLCSLRWRNISVALISPIATEKLIYQPQEEKFCSAVSYQLNLILFFHTSKIVFQKMLYKMRVYIS